MSLGPHTGSRASAGSDSREPCGLALIFRWGVWPGSCVSSYAPALGVYVEHLCFASPGHPAGKRHERQRPPDEKQYLQPEGGEPGARGRGPEAHAGRALPRRAAGREPIPQWPPLCPQQPEPDTHWRWAGSTALLCYGQMVAHAGAQILPWVDNIVSRMVYYFSCSRYVSAATAGTAGGVGAARPLTGAGPLTLPGLHTDRTTSSRPASFRPPSCF